jgi:hypothetical protein
MPAENFRVEPNADPSSPAFADESISPKTRSVAALKVYLAIFEILAVFIILYSLETNSFTACQRKSEIHAE